VIARSWVRIPPPALSVCVQSALQAERCRTARGAGTGPWRREAVGLAENIRSVCGEEPAERNFAISPRLDLPYVDRVRRVQRTDLRRAPRLVVAVQGASLRGVETH